MTDTLTTLTGKLSANRLAQETPDPNVPLSQLGLTVSDVHAAVAQMPAAHGTNPQAPRDSTERGLADLAAFSATARTALDAYAPAPPAATLRSIAQEIDNGTYESAFSASPRSKVIMRFGSIFAMAVAVPAVLATQVPPPVCTVCSLSPMEHFTGYATFSIPAAFIVTLAALAPAIWHISRTNAGTYPALQKPATPERA